MATIPYEQVLELALQLSTKERLQLAEDVKASLENETPEAKTGAEIVAILETMESIEFVDPQIEDPVEWVKAQRQKRADKLKPYREGDL